MKIELEFAECIWFQHATLYTSFHSTTFIIYSFYLTQQINKYERLILSLNTKQGLSKQTYNLNSNINNNKKDVK